ncbi:DUF6221 family protein [Cellulosimicrobium cellulans]|uniref:DUF6221 family protein n=1 Tax=Cellulosimicrobium cellulans TaxID=1710 RepID=UPI0036E319F3
MSADMGELKEFALARIEDDRRTADQMTDPDAYPVRDKLYAECDAKRNIVALATEPPAAQFYDAAGGQSVPTSQSMPRGYSVGLLRVLAGLYRDHPDFDDAWV